MKWITPRRAIIFALILLAGFIGWRILVNKNQAKSEIKTATVVRKNVTSTLTASGRIAASRTASLNFPISGKLGFVRVKTGDSVMAYQTLAGMDVADLDTAITKAWYTYLAADAAAKVAEDSVKGHEADETFVQKNTRVTAQTARDAAYDVWKAALRAKQNSYLVAPFAGVVTAVTVTASGDTIGVTDGITVVDPKSLHFLAEVDETDIGKVYVGQTVTFKLDALAGREIAGVVERIGFQSTLSDSGGTVYLVDVKPEDSALSLLRIGMNGDVTMVLEKADQVLSIPADAVIDGEVTVANGVKKKVVIGVLGDVEVEIKSGLLEGETVWLSQ